VGRLGVIDRCSFPIIGQGERARLMRVPRPLVQGEPWHAVDGRPSSWGAKWPQTMDGRLGELAGWPVIFSYGASAPPVTSLAASKSFSWSVDATKAHGSGELSIEGIHGRGEDEQELWKRSEGEGDELRDLKGENPYFFSEFYRSKI
jgi:hypothetical protein